MLASPVARRISSSASPARRKGRGLTGSSHTERRGRCRLVGSRALTRADRSLPGSRYSGRRWCCVEFITSSALSGTPDADWSMFG